MIILDLLINIILGLHYMHQRNTVMGALMVKCPIAISPAIFFAEFVVVILYYYWKKREAEKKAKVVPIVLSEKKSEEKISETSLTVGGQAQEAEEKMSPQMRAALKRRPRGPMGTFFYLSLIILNCNR